MEREINILENPVIGGIEQWILVRGKNAFNPVLLLLQAGPGFPMISEAESFENKLELEEYFAVVYWDQRGCGKTYSKNIPADSMNLNKLVSDTNELTEYLKQKFNKDKIFIAGFSLGGTTALIAASKFPGNFITAFLVGPDLIMKDAEQYAYDFALSEAAKRKNNKALTQLKRIGLPPHLTNKKFQTRVKWVTNFGGTSSHETFFSIFIKTIGNMFKSKYYSIKDIFKTLTGMGFSQKHLLPKLASLNLFETVKNIDTKVYFIQGKNDAAAPCDLAVKYFEYLRAPKGKNLFIFENSAHMPYMEEPKRFRDILINKVKEEKNYNKGN